MRIEDIFQLKSMRKRNIYQSNSSKVCNSHELQKISTEIYWLHITVVAAIATANKEELLAVLQPPGQLCKVLFF